MNAELGKSLRRFSAIVVIAAYLSPAVGAETVRDLAAEKAEKKAVSDHLELITGPVNGAILTDGHRRLIVYGDARKSQKAQYDPASVEAVLFTHFRRDAAWAGVKFLEAGAEAIVPLKEKDRFVDPNAFWRKHRKSRFRNGGLRSSHVFLESVCSERRCRPVDESEVIEFSAGDLHVLDTPGYTRGSVSYWADLDGQRVVFCGDLMYGKGQLLDFFPLQDTIPEAKIGGYHGYAARTADLIASLSRLARLEPDLLIPARGPVVENPRKAIENEIARLRKIYRNYLRMISIRWYFGDERMKTSARKVLETDQIDWMPMAEEFENPQWLIPLGNTRVLVSESGAAWVIDCGGKSVYQKVRNLLSEGAIVRVEGIFVTHYHHDHTPYVAEAARQFECPVYCTKKQADILKNPRSFHMPCLIEEPIENLHVVEDGFSCDWHEFRFTFYWYPGQTLYHDAMLVEKRDPADDSPPYFFVGDSFGPSGPDDYCLWNRNFLKEGAGYLYCFDLLKTLPENTRIVNQHVPPPFTYTSDQISFMIGSLRERREIMEELFPWEHPDFALDHAWVRFDPYSIEAAPGETVPVKLVFFNHSDRPRQAVFSLRAPPGLDLPGGLQKVTCSPRGETEWSFELTIPPQTEEALELITVDLKWGEHFLIGWTEGLVEIAEHPKNSEPMSTTGSPSPGASTREPKGPH
jgi:glyoxylase-like metal-dependent hydrolase (beta-lactamase superfamily II)